MMRLSLRLTLIVFVVASLWSCNNDIFLGRDESAVDLYGYVDGDGGSTTFRIPTYELLSIRLDGMNNPNLTCYNDRDEEVAQDSPYPQISRLVYESQWLKFEILISGGQVSITSFYNSENNVHNIKLRLDYSYGVRIIDVTIGQGEAAVFEGVEYDPDIVLESPKVDTRSLMLSNASGSQFTYSINPYLNYSLRFVIIPAASWAYFKTIDLRIPEYIDGEWRFSEKQAVKLAETITKNLQYDGEMLEIVLADGASARIVSTVTSEIATATGRIFYRNPITDKVYSTDFKTTVAIPVDYDVKVSYN